MRASGNTVLITGGATGIGFALAEALVSRRNTVGICGRRQAALLAARRRIPSLAVKVCDVSRSSPRRALLEWARRRLPALNILVNNAGIQRCVDFRLGTRHLPAVDEEIRTNLLAPIHLAALFLPVLRRRPRAAIINISSGLGFTPLAVVPIYSATKAAIHSFSLSLRHQLRETSVRVFEVAPPMVPTALSGSRRRREDAPHSMSAEAVAEGILEALEGDTYEVALGPASWLQEQRESAFEAIND